MRENVHVRLDKITRIRGKIYKKATQARGKTYNTCMFWEYMYVLGIFDLKGIFLK